MIKPQDVDNMPRDANIMSLLLKSMDIEEYEASTIPQLLDFSHRNLQLREPITQAGFIVELIQDAQLFAEHASRQEIDVEDVKLAIEGKISHSFTYPPSKDFLCEIAEKKNAQPLPIVPDKFGIRMPPERHCLTGVNFDILPKRIIVEKPEEEEYDAMEEVKHIKAQVQQFEAATKEFNMPDIMGGETAPAFEMPAVQSASNAMDEDDEYDNI